MKIEIKPDPLYPATHTLVKISHRGRVYATRWANPPPTLGRIVEEWKIDRDSFLPYDESTGRFLHFTR